MPNKNVKPLPVWLESYSRDLVRVVRAIEAKYGKEGKKVAREGFLSDLKKRASEARNGKGDVQAFCADLEKKCADTHEWERVIDKQNRVAYRFTRCAYAEAFRRLGAADIGKWFCDTDEPAAKAANLGFKRTKTLMEGDEICDHVFYVEER